MVDEGDNVHNDDGDCKERLRLLAVWNVGWIFRNTTVLRDVPRCSGLGMLRIRLVAASLVRGRSDVEAK